MSAPALAGLQQALQRSILSGAAPPALLARIAGDERADAAARVGIYIDAYRLRLVEALTKDYPVLAAVLGESGFSRLGRAYLEAQPSTTPSLRPFGRHLADFVAGAAPWSRRPAWSELARFEWAQGEVFDAPDEQTLSIEAMGRIPARAWPTLRLQPLAALRRLDLLSNAPAVVAAEVHGRSRPALRRARRARAWLLWRDAALDVRWRSLPTDEAAAWDALAAGAAFGAICDRLCDFIAAPAAPLHAASLLKRWLSDGLISSSGFA